MAADPQHQRGYTGCLCRQRQPPARRQIEHARIAGQFDHYRAQRRTAHGIRRRTQHRGGIGQYAQDQMRRIETDLRQPLGMQPPHALFGGIFTQPQQFATQPPGHHTGKAGAPAVTPVRDQQLMHPPAHHAAAERCVDRLIPRRDTAGRFHRHATAFDQRDTALEQMKRLMGHMFAICSTLPYTSVKRCCAGNTLDNGPLTSLGMIDRRIVVRLIMSFIAAALTVTSATARAGEVTVAVAANFAEPARDIAEAYTRSSGHKVTVSIGSSGAFAAQIMQRAPFEIFLSADADRPMQLEKAGLTVPGSRVTYAIGRLVLYSAHPDLADAGAETLRTARFGKLAIADPRLAPYGTAAMQTMTRLGLYSRLAPRIVKGSSIAQTFQFTASGIADLGFVALSQVVTVKGGSRWLVPDRYHKPIAQQAVLLKTGARDPAAVGFMRFLKSATARGIITRYGYRAP